MVTISDFKKVKNGWIWLGLVVSCWKHALCIDFQRRNFESLIMTIQMKNLKIGRWLVMALAAIDAHNPMVCLLQISPFHKSMQSTLINLPDTIMARFCAAIAPANAMFNHPCQIEHSRHCSEINSISPLLSRLIPVIFSPHRRTSILEKSLLCEVS